MLLVGRHIYYMDFKLQLSEMMTREAIKERKPEPKIVEDEFVLHVLMKENLVDQQMIDHIKAEFHKIERPDIFITGRPSPKGVGSYPFAIPSSSESKILLRLYARLTTILLPKPGK